MIVHAQDCSYVNITIVPPEYEGSVIFYEVETDYGARLCQLQPRSGRNCYNWVWRCSSYFAYRGIVCFNNGYPGYICGGKITRGGWTPPSGMCTSFISVHLWHFDPPNSPASFLLVPSPPSNEREFPQKLEMTLHQLTDGAQSYFYTAYWNALGNSTEHTAGCNVATSICTIEGLNATDPYEVRIRVCFAPNNDAYHVCAQLSGSVTTWTSPYGN